MRRTSTSRAGRAMSARVCRRSSTLGCHRSTTCDPRPSSRRRPRPEAHAIGVSTIRRLARAMPPGRCHRSSTSHVTVRRRGPGGSPRLPPPGMREPRTRGTTVRISTTRDLAMMVREARILNHMTQADLAEHLGGEPRLGDPPRTGRAEDRARHGPDGDACARARDQRSVPARRSNEPAAGRRGRRLGRGHPQDRPCVVQRRAAGPVHPQVQGHPSGAGRGGPVARPARRAGAAAGRPGARPGRAPGSRAAHCRTASPRRGGPGRCSSAARSRASSPIPPRPRRDRTGTS